MKGTMKDKIKDSLEWAMIIIWGLLILAAFAYTIHVEYPGLLYGLALLAGLFIINTVGGLIGHTLRCGHDTQGDIPDDKDQETHS